jgi:hypothetical protein
MSIAAPNLQQLASGLPSEIQQALRSALSAQDKFNVDVARAFANLSSWAWVRPKLLNGWVDFSATLVAQYAVLSCGLIILAGSIKSGTIGTAAWTMPTALCPSQDINMETPSNGVRGVVVVSPSGAVIPQVGSNTFMALDGCLYLPAQAPG